MLLLGLVALLTLFNVPYLIVYIASGLAVVFFFLVAQFFRVPKRSINNIEGKIICPSDGKVVVIEKVHEPEYFKDERIHGLQIRIINSLGTSPILFALILTCSGLSSPLTYNTLEPDSLARNAT